jgi:hypothetical protein
MKGRAQFSYHPSLTSSQAGTMLLPGSTAMAPLRRIFFGKLAVELFTARLGCEAIETKRNL